jgi:ABC-2 type transport system ATP-binding protein
MITAIATRNLTRRFGNLTAVDRLDLNIPEGSLFGLIGPNGAGKTTTLRMLAGLLEPTAGEIRIQQLPVRQYWDEIQWQVGYMPDFFGVYEDLLVWEYLDFFARCYRLSPQKRQRIVTDLLELVDLGEKREAYVNTLSRGMRQRLCLAHALVHDPQVLLLDEPASGLDPRARVEMRELLRELRSMGKTIVLSSHILTELADLCDSIGIMEKGRLVASGTLDEIRLRVQPERRLNIQLLSDPSAAIASISELPGVDKVSSNSDQLEVLFTGDEQSAADLLDTLIKRGARITAFQEIKSDLEEVYLKLTTQEET